MIAEEYLGGSRLFRRLKSGPEGQLVEVSAAWLAEDGLVRQALRGAGQRSPELDRRQPLRADRPR
jgi:hypothetical protein